MDTRTRTAVALALLVALVAACTNPGPWPTIADAGAPDTTSPGVWQDLGDAAEPGDLPAPAPAHPNLGQSAIPVPACTDAGVFLGCTGPNVLPGWYVPAGGGGSDGGPITLAGDTTGPSNANTTVAINGASVPLAGALTVGNALQVAGTSSLTYAPINLAGGSTYVTGTLPVGNLPNLAGDTTGAITSNTVGKIQGNTVTGGALTKGTFLIASSTSNWADTALSGDVAGSAVTPGLLTVTGLQGIAVPSPSGSSTVLTYNAGAYTWSTTGSGVTWANDLAGSSNTHQYLVNISGGAVPATVTITAPTLSASQASTWKTTAGALTIDSAAALNLGASTATALTIGNASDTGVSITAGATHAISHVIGSTVVEQQAQASTDYIALGASPASSGYVRVPSGTQNIIASAANVLMQVDSTNGYLNLNPPTGSGLNVKIGGTTEAFYADASFLISNGGTWEMGTDADWNIQYALTSGTPHALHITGEDGAGTNITGGAVYLTSGSGTGTGASGAIHLQPGGTEVVQLTDSQAFFYQPPQPHGDLTVALGTSSERWAAGWISNYQFAGQTGAANTQQGLSAHVVAVLRSTDALAHTIQTVPLTSHHATVVRTRGCARVVSAGTSGFAVDSVNCFEWRVSGGYNGTNVITPTGSTGTQNAVVWQDNENFAVNFTTSGGTININVQYGSTGSPTLDWQVECDIQEI